MDSPRGLTSRTATAIGGRRCLGSCRR
jgi:hypothetical protein